MNGVQQWLRFFEQVSCFNKQGMILLWNNEYPNHTTDIWDSLAIFLEGYAFERQGRKPDYFHAAVDALLGYKREHNGNMSNNIAEDIWSRFSNFLNGQKLNCQNNPLCPNGTSYRRKENTCKTSKLSVIQIVSNKINTQSNSLTTYLKDKIVKDDIKRVFDLLKSIQGVSDKIASLFLRDLAYIMEIDLSKTQNRHLLQPIDIWVARTVMSLDENEFSYLKEKIKNGRSLNNKDKVKLAEWIVRQSEGNAANPELVNMGIWYFCSQIAISRYRLNRVLENLNDLSRAKSLAHKHAMWIKNVFKNCQNFA